MVLETSRLSLRCLTDGDYADLCRVMLQDPEVMYAYAHAFSDEEAWEWLHRQQTRYREDGFGLWAVELRKTGELIGQCGVTWQTVRDRRVPEIGYLLGKSSWGRGYAIEAARACSYSGLRRGIFHHPRQQPGIPAGGHPQRHAAL